jgi:hypothetical protein
MLFRICHKFQKYKSICEIHGKNLIENQKKNLLGIDRGIIIVRNFYLSLQIEY